ncbi:Hypothetical predicted protein [Prunus dulcis]|uniref:Uncharacterized protein n=1 Tax=Prunus dulcis TaxID=3755 RepID=A0A5E4EUF6_PRUDU|nr:Hypothetical predicted protein [Prunus dulcis]
MEMKASIETVKKSITNLNRTLLKTAALFDIFVQGICSTVNKEQFEKALNRAWRTTSGFKTSTQIYFLYKGSFSSN